MSRNTKVTLSILFVLVGAFLLFRTGEKLLAPFFGQSETPAASLVNASQGLSVGSRAPYFELSDLAGNRVHLSDFLHTPLLVLFWSTSIGDAQDQIKIIDDYRAAHPHALFQIVTINIQDDKSAVRAFIGRGKYDVPVLLDEHGITGGLYHMQTLPASFFIDSNGVIRTVHVGLMSQQMIEGSSESIITSGGI